MNVIFHIPAAPLSEFVESIAFLGGREIGNGIAFQRWNQAIIINCGGLAFNGHMLFAEQLLACTDVHAGSKLIEDYDRA